MATVEQALTAQITTEQNLLGTSRQELDQAAKAERAARININNQIKSNATLEQEIADKRLELAAAAPADWPAIQAVIKQKEFELSDERGKLLNMQAAANNATIGVTRATERVSRTTERLAALVARKDKAVEDTQRHTEIKTALAAPQITALPAQVSGLATQLNQRDTALNALVTKHIVDLARERRRLEDLGRQNARRLRETAVDKRSAAARTRFGIDYATTAAQVAYERKRAEAESYVAGVRTSINQVIAFLAEPVPVLSAQQIKEISDLDKVTANKKAANDAIAYIEEESDFQKALFLRNQHILAVLADPAAPPGNVLTDFADALKDRDKAVDTFAPQKAALDAIETAVPPVMHAYLRRLGDAREVIDRLSAQDPATLAGELDTAQTAVATAVTNAATVHRDFDKLDAEAAALAVGADATEEMFNARAWAAARGDDVAPVKLGP